MKYVALSIVMLLFVIAPASAQQPKPPKKLTWDEQLDRIMPPITEAVGLDGLQEAAIRQILLNQMRQSDMLNKETSMTDEAKRDEAMTVIEKTDTEIKKLLSPKQIELYDQYKIDIRSGKAGKKKKKKS